MPIAKYGFDGQIYANGGTYGSPTFQVMLNVRDCAVQADMDKHDATTRAGGGMKQYEPTLLDLAFTGKVRSDDTDTAGYAKLSTAFHAGSSLDVMILDGAMTTNGSQGYRFDAKVFKFGEDQAIDGVLFREFELAPCVSTNQPKLATVASGSPSYASLAR
jgi:hypothetical protein